MHVGNSSQLARHSFPRPEIKPEPDESQLPRTRDPIRSWGREGAGKDFGFHVGNSFQLARHRNNIASQAAMCVSFNLFCEHIAFLFSGSRVRPDCPAISPEFVAMPAQAKLQNPPRNKSSFMEFGEAFTIVQDLAEFYRVLSATNADAILELAIVTAVDANCTPSPRLRLSSETRNSGSTGDELFLNQDMGRRPRFVLAHNNNNQGPCPCQVSGCEREWFGGRSWREVGRLPR